MTGCVVIRTRVPMYNRKTGGTAEKLYFVPLFGAEFFISYEGKGKKNERTVTTN